MIFNAGGEIQNHQQGLIMSNDLYAWKVNNQSFKGSGGPAFYEPPMCIHRVKKAHLWQSSKRPSGGESLKKRYRDYFLCSKQCFTKRFTDRCQPVFSYGWKRCQESIAYHCMDLDPVNGG